MSSAGMILVTLLNVEQLVEPSPHSQLSPFPQLAPHYCSLPRNCPPKRTRNFLLKAGVVSSMNLYRTMRRDGPLQYGWIMRMHHNLPRPSFGRCSLTPYITWLTR